MIFEIYDGLTEYTQIHIHTHTVQRTMCNTTLKHRLNPRVQEVTPPVPGFRFRTVPATSTQARVHVMV